METLATQARGSCTVVSTITGINNNGLLEVLSRDGSLPFKQLTPYNRKKQHYCYWNNAVLILILKQYTGNILKIYTYQSRLKSRWVGQVLKLFASMFGKVSISMGTDSWGTEDDRRWYWYLLVSTAPRKRNFVRPSHPLHPRSKRATSHVFTENVVCLLFGGYPKTKEIFTDHSWK